MAKIAQARPKPSQSQHIKMIIKNIEYVYYS